MIHCSQREVNKLFLLADQALSEDVAPWEFEEQIQMLVNIAHGTYRLAKDWRVMDDWLTDSLTIQTLLRAEFWCYEQAGFEDEEEADRASEAIDIMESAIRYINARGGRDLEEFGIVTRARAAGMKNGLEHISCMDSGEKIRPFHCEDCALFKAEHFDRAADRLDPPDDTPPTRLDRLAEAAEGEKLTACPCPCHELESQGICNECTPGHDDEPDTSSNENEYQRRLAEGKEWKS